MTEAIENEKQNFEHGISGVAIPLVKRTSQV
jgi:hypothetical protein